MQDYNKLAVWSKAHSLTLKTYKITAKFPKEELFALVSQMRRSASSIPMNIAEGCGRNTKSDLAHFLNMALGSTNEIDYQYLLSKDLFYISEDEYNIIQPEIGEIKAMLISLITKIRQAI